MASAGASPGPTLPGLAQVPRFLPCHQEPVGRMLTWAESVPWRPGGCLVDGQGGRGAPRPRLACPSRLGCACRRGIATTRAEGVAGHHLPHPTRHGGLRGSIGPGPIAHLPAPKVQRFQGLGVVVTGPLQNGTRGVAVVHGAASTNPSGGQGEDRGPPNGLGGRARWSPIPTTAGGVGGCHLATGQEPPLRHRSRLCACAPSRASPKHAPESSHTPPSHRWAPGHRATARPVTAFPLGNGSSGACALSTKRACQRLLVAARRPRVMRQTHQTLCTTVPRSTTSSGAWSGAQPLLARRTARPHGVSSTSPLAHPAGMTYGESRPRPDSGVTERDVQPLPGRVVGPGEVVRGRGRPTVTGDHFGEHGRSRPAGGCTPVWGRPPSTTKVAGGGRRAPSSSRLTTPTTRSPGRGWLVARSLGGQEWQHSGLGRDVLCSHRHRPTLQRGVPRTRPGSSHCDPRCAAPTR